MFLWNVLGKRIDFTSFQNAWRSILFPSEIAAHKDVILCVPIAQPFMGWGQSIKIRQGKHILSG